MRGQIIKFHPFEFHLFYSLALQIHQNEPLKSIPMETIDDL